MSPLGPRTRDRKRHRPICPNGAMHTSPGCQPWEPHPRDGVCSERTPHRVGRGRCPRHQEYAAFLQNACFFFRVYSQGLHPGLVCDAPTGHGIGNVIWWHRDRERGLVAQGSGTWFGGTGIGNVVWWHRDRKRDLVAQGSETWWSIGSNETAPTHWNAMPRWGTGTPSFHLAQRVRTNLMERDVPFGAMGLYPQDRSRLRPRLPR
jgi:hypothetical protein